MEANTLGLRKSQRMVVVQVLVQLCQHPPKDAHYIWLGSMPKRSHCRHISEGITNQSIVYLHGAGCRIICGALHRLESQFPNSDRATPLACSMYHSDGITCRPDKGHVACGAVPHSAADLPTSDRSSFSSKFVFTQWPSVVYIGTISTGGQDFKSCI